MGTISSNIGLISGIDYKSLVDKLIQVQSGTVNNQTAQNKKFDGQRTAITTLEASLIALQFNTNKLGTSSLYNQRSVTSSDDSTVTATVTGQSQVGQYQITPVQLAQSQQFQSSKFASDSTAIGAGTLTLRDGGFIDPGVSLDLLNGGEGFTRGQIKITDRSGASAVIDLRFARTVDDVLSAINSNTTIGVKASTKGDQFVLIDSTGQSASNLKVQEVGGGVTAASLGLVSINAGSAQASGTDALSLFDDLSLRLLNDNGGVRFNNFLSDLQINFRDGSTATVDFHRLAQTVPTPLSATNEQTLSDVIDTLNNAAPGKLHAAIGPDGDRLVLTDLTTDNGSTFSVAALNGSKAAYDLGLDTTAAGSSISGRRLLGGLKTVLLSSLNGGTGLGTLGSINITDRGGNPAPVNLATAETLDDVVSSINDAGIGVQAQVNDARNGIEVIDTTGQSVSNLIVANADATNTADKLGLTLNAAATSKSSGNLKLRTVNENTLLSSLNGGAGVGNGSLKITDTAGHSGTVSINSSIKTVGDVLRAISLLGISVDARVNNAGDGILIDDTAHGAGALAVTAGSGTAARDLHLLAAAQSVIIAGVPTQEIDGSTMLKITLSATDTLKDLVTKINSARFNVQAAAISDGSAVKPFRLTLSNTRSGKASELSIDTSGVDFSLAETVQAQDAVAVLGSPNSTSSIIAASANNTFSNLLPGLSVNVKSASATPITLNVAAANTDLASTLQAIVDSYNRLHSQIAQATKFDTTSNTAAVLQGDPTVLRVNTDLTNLIAGRAFGAGSIQSLAQLGITAGDDGTLKFDQTVFQAESNQDPQAVQDFFSTKDSGISDRFKKLIDSLAGPGSSLLVSRADTLSRKIDDGQKRIDLLNARLDSLRTRLLNQFNNAELAISKLQSNLDALSAIQPFATLTTNQSSSSTSKTASASNLTG